jgi:TolA-binding protein
MSSLMWLAACTQLTLADPNGQSDFDRTLNNARRDVDAGNYFAADKLLDEYVRVHPNTREAKEVAFWKAAYLVDPANETGSLATGIAALDAYLAATDSSGLYRNEALVLRRTAATAQGVTGASQGTSADSSGSSGTASGAKDTVVVVRRSRDEEIASLREQLAKSKDELAKVSAELDRIKKRLANPNH